MNSLFYEKHNIKYNIPKFFSILYNNIILVAFVSS